MIDKNNSRTTIQRRIILEVIRGTNTHPTADWIYKQAKERNINISRSTVYRNLNLLLQEGKIIRLDTGNEVSRYDGNVNRHTHLSCTNCGKLIDLMDVNIDIDENRISKNSGYIISSAHLILYGVCPNCQRKI